MTEIETKAKFLAAARNSISDIVADMNQEIEEIKRAYMHDLKQAVARAAHHQEDLRAAIEAAPELFIKPRTQVFHGIKVGLREGAGAIDWTDDERTSDLIQKHFPELFAVLVKTTRKPQARALRLHLSPGDLRKVEVFAQPEGDVVVIKPTDSEVDKVVNALLKGAVDEVQKAA